MQKSHDILTVPKKHLTEKQNKRNLNVLLLRDTKNCERYAAENEAQGENQITIVK